MRDVVDTSVLVDHLRGDQRATNLLRSLFGRGGVAASVMTRVEILAGMRAPEKRATERLLALIDWIPVNVDLADIAGEMARRHRASHPGVDSVDYVIAATTEVLGAQLHTRNVRHFPMFKGLRDAYATTP